MKSLGEVAGAAIQANHRAGWAIKLVLGDDTTYRWKDVPEPVTIDSQPYTSRPFVLSPPSAMDSSTLTQAAARVADGDGLVAAALRQGLLKEAQLTMYELLSTGPTVPLASVLHFVGAVESVSVEDDWAALRLGPPAQPWALLVPPITTAWCRYQSTVQCPYVEDCAKTWVACQGNAKTDIFGGFRFLVPAGTVLTFRDGQVTVTPY